MTPRGILARASVLCAVSALGACATATHNARNTVPAPVLASTATYRQPEISPASTALARVTEALNVSVRQINATGRPPASLLASNDVNPRTVLISHRLQCVPFARERSGVAIRGNANTWWAQAAGDFIRVKAPTIGAVMVMQTRRGHVAVVTKIIDSRHIVVDHSNWLSNGQIYLDQPIMDVSANNDWTKVVVWHPNLVQFGKRALGVSGFIVDAPARGNQTVFASLADVPASLAGDIQYAEAVVTPKTAAPAQAAVAGVPATVAATTPVLVADATPRNAGPLLQPLAKPDNVTLRGAPLDTAPAVEAVIASAKPVYVDMIVPGAKPASIAAPMALASAEQIQQAEAVQAAAQPAGPVFVDTIVPTAKPAALRAPAAIAAAEPAPQVEAQQVASAAPVYVDIIVPSAKPSVLGAAAVAEIRKGDAPATSEAAFVPAGKPASVATFR